MSAIIVFPTQLAVNSDNAVTVTADWVTTDDTGTAIGQGTATVVVAYNQWGDTIFNNLLTAVREQIGDPNFGDNAVYVTSIGE